ncbi:class I SAM-dependent methyltransferase [Roseateles sp. BYS180W]|uniref:Class I SAM-dependent methyltransferase n=1 Tax=Roseateles rivi TaxID=3299028 RepID=A0ABW7FVM2_9BURK
MNGDSPIVVSPSGWTEDDAWAAWLDTPPGRYLLDWAQPRIDSAVADCFGFHALQLGMPALQGLRANRMPQRWLAQEGSEHASAALLCEFDALPFPSSSLDLVVLPHTLERTQDPHRCLREVERVLRPEGRLVVLGMNPAGAWVLRQNLGLLRPRRPGRPRELFLPELPAQAEYLGYWRLRDWLRLLGLEIFEAEFGAYRMPWRSQTWLERGAVLERLGARWWPVLGAVYMVQAVKRVPAMRLIKPARRRAASGSAPAVAVGRHAPTPWPQPFSSSEPE